MTTKSVSDKPAEPQNTLATVANQEQATAAINAIKQGGAGFGSRSTTHAPKAPIRISGSESPAREIKIKPSRLIEIKQAAIGVANIQEANLKVRPKDNKAAEGDETRAKMLLYIAINHGAFLDNNLNAADATSLKKFCTKLHEAVTADGGFKKNKYNVAAITDAINRFRESLNIVDDKKINKLNPNSKNSNRGKQK